MRSSTVVIGAASAIGVLGTIWYCSSGDGRQAGPAAAVSSAAPSASVPSVPPLRDDERDVVTTLVKTALCEPSTCDPIACEQFSAGVAKGNPAKVAKCRWIDTRAPSAPDRCAYVHLSFEAAKNRFGDLLLSAVTSSAVCQPDKAFNTQVSGELGYTGALP